FLLTIPRPPGATLFPYTTLFRSWRRDSGRTCAAPERHRRLAGRRLGTRGHPDSARAGAALPDCARADRDRARAPQGQPLAFARRSEEHTSQLQSLTNLVCRLLLY